MFGQRIRGRRVIATIAVWMALLAADSGATAGTKVMRTPDGDSCAQADSAPQQRLPAVIEACDVVVTQAQGANLGRFHRYRGRALQKTGELTRARSDFDQALAILPNDEWSLKWRSAVREALGDNGGAIDDYRRLNALQPNFSDWRRAIVRLGGSVGSPPKSEVASESPPASNEVAGPPQVKQAQAVAATLSQSRQQPSAVPADAAKAPAATDGLEAVLDDILGQPDVGKGVPDVEKEAAEEQQAQEAERIELVRRTQTELKRLGYDIGEVDGVAGSRTRNSLRDWLQRSGQPTDRELDVQLVAELGRAQVPVRLEVAEAETKGLEPETGAGAKPPAAPPQDPVKEQVQAPPKGPMIAAVGPLNRVPPAAVALPESPKRPPAASLIPPRTDGEKRVALVIGNSSYRNVVSLRNPRQDAEDMSAALEEMGFKVFPGYDLDRNAMDDLTTEFAREAADADLALTYYSGHALQYAGANLLVPVDGHLEDQYSLRRLVRLDQLIQDTGGARKLAVVIVDACRDDPLAGRQSAMGTARSLAVPKGLAQPGYVPPRTLVAYATSPGMVAYDGNGRNSPYVSALLRHIKTPGLKVQDMFAAVTGDVARETADAQRPGTYSSLDAAAVYLVPSAPEANGIELSQLTRGEVRAIELSLRWLGFWSGDADGQVSPALVEAMHRSQGSQSANSTDVVTTAEIVALHRRAASARPRVPLPAIGNMNQLLRQAAQGDAKAQRMVGMVNDPAFDVGPLTKDQESARDWYKSAATAGDAEAAARLGLMLAAPGSSAVDQREARQWLETAAKAGDPAAALRLAELLLDEGKDSPARPQAIEFLKVAAAKPETDGFANALLRDLGYRVELSSNL